MLRTSSLIALLWGALFSTCLALNQDLPEQILVWSSQPGKVILYSIYPDPDPDGEQFLGYPVLGKAELQPAEASVVVAAVLKGLREADPSVRQSCFSPRHALESEGHKFLICFACNSVVYEAPDGQKRNFAITSSGNEELAGAVLKRHLPWQGWQPLDGAVWHRSGLTVLVPRGYRAHGAAGTETLFLTSLEAIPQALPMPGVVVLETPDGQSEELPSRWLDHSQTGSAMWYLTSLPNTYDPSRNRRTFRGSSYELAHIKTQLQESDVPALRAARIKVRPVHDPAALRRQERRLQRDGGETSSVEIAGVQFLVTRSLDRGLEIERAAGLVRTNHGDVLVIAEVPTGLESVLAQVVQSLEGEARVR
ncbi:MAG: hypothetical protein WC314_26135 [Vulcanimicrobiota bacterium]